MTRFALPICLVKNLKSSYLSSLALQLAASVHTSTLIQTARIKVDRPDKPHSALWRHSNETITRRLNENRRGNQQVWSSIGFQIFFGKRSILTDRPMFTWQKIKCFLLHQRFCRKHSKGMLIFSITKKENTSFFSSCCFPLLIGIFF